MDLKDLRYAIQEELKSNATLVSGRVFATFTAPAGGDKPYLEVGIIGELPAVNPHGMFYQLEVLCIGDPVDRLLLDDVADQVITLLHDVHLTSPDGRVFYCTYTRDGRVDQFSNDVNGLVTRLKFLVPSDFWT